MSKFNYYHGGSAARKNFSGAGGGVSLDYKIKVSNADTTPNFAENKLLAGSNITIAKSGTGADEILTFSAPSPTVLDGKLKVSSADTTPNFAEDKLLAGSNITITKSGTGADEKLTFAATGTGQKNYSYNFGTGLAIAGGGVFLVPGTAASSFPSNGMGFYINENQIITNVSICIDKILTFSSSESITFQVRKLPANGSSIAELTMAMGTLLTSITLTGLNTSGSVRWIYGTASNGLNVSVSAGDLLFIGSSSSSMNTVQGVVATINTKV